MISAVTFKRKQVAKQIIAESNQKVYKIQYYYKK